ncbi:MAG: peptidoglycan recognition protein family protein, partial [Sarcina sp.]
ERIHQMHLNNGWSGIGYHFVVRQNGTIERGRPENKMGAHCVNANTGRIGICFPGDFDKNKMNQIQINSGKEIVANLKNKYPKAVIKPHKKVINQSTACPGRYFPFDEIVNGISISKPDSSSDKKLWEKSIQGQEVNDLQVAIKITPADGLFGDNTLKACPLLRKGSKGQVVKLAQKRLLNRGYNLPKFGADGDFGDEMVAAIKRLQDCFSLSQDGIIGEKTWKVLYGLDKGKF